MSRRTVSDTFGLDIANELAAIAIDLLCDAPARITTSDTKIKASLVAEGREILDLAGIDWRTLVGNRVDLEREAAGRVQTERIEREAGKRTTAELEALLARLDPADSFRRAIIERVLAERQDAR